jgi:O-antigen ligase
MRHVTQTIPRWATGGTPQARQYLAQLRDQRVRDRGAKFFTFVAFILLGLGILGKPFAYTFVGDALLIVGLFVLLHSPGRKILVSQPILAPLCLFMFWGAARTMPYLSKYRLDAVRDAVIWGYGLWVFVVAGLLCASPQRLIWLIRKYSIFMWIFLFAIPPLYLAFRVLGPMLPQMPGAGVPIIHVKAGDVLVHLGGIIAFLMLFNQTSKLWLKIPLIGLIVALEGTNRGGLVSLLAATFVAFIARPGSKVVWVLAISAAYGILMLWVTGLQIQAPGANRAISFDDLQNSAQSVTGHGNNGDRDATREWRLSWWKDIINYTIHGRYFWMGKGFGINLALDDGYDVTGSGELRSPHNGHIMILARTGVPGASLWLLTQGCWLFSMIGAYRRSRRAADRRWSAVFAFLLAYWTGFMTNATFDVFLEGPMGGVWFWTVYGIGIAAMWIFINCPEAMYPQDAAPQPVAPHPQPYFNPTWNRTLIPAG